MLHPSLCCSDSQQKKYAWSLWPQTLIRVTLAHSFSFSLLSHTNNNPSPTLCLTGPYGVDLEDSTMGVIRRHANNMHRLTSAIPPRPSCVFPASAKKPLGAWFAANSSPGAARRDCINAPDVSLAFYMLYGES